MVRGVKVCEAISHPLGSRNQSSWAPSVPFCSLSIFVENLRWYGGPPQGAWRGFIATTWSEKSLSELTVCRWLMCQTDLSVSSGLTTGSSVPVGDGIS